MTELKPCPFCGGKAANCTKQYDGHIYRYRIQCNNAKLYLDAGTSIQLLTANN